MYNVEICDVENNGKLMFNTYSTAFGVMDKETQNIYNSIENLNEDKIENIKTQDLINILKSNGFIVNKDLKEYEQVNFKQKVQRYNNKNFNLTIAPTMNCNMECPYCYEEKINSMMTNDTMLLLMNFVRKFILENGVKNFSVEWYGGEPLLALNVIKKLSKEFISICKENSVEYSASIVSNGILLDYDVANTLKNDCNITSAQITIDGMKELHNKRRILKNNGDSFVIITDNIESIKDILNIIIRVNVDKNNLIDMPKLIDYIIDEKQWGNKVRLYFYPVVNQTNACKADANMCINQNEFGEIYKKLLQLIHNKRNNDFISKLYPRRECTFCTAITSNSLVIDPNGYFYTCWNLIGLKDERIGDSENGVVLDEKYLKWMTLDIPASCNECVYLPLCGGGCPLLRLQNNNKPVCDYKKVILSQLLKLTYEEAKVLK